MKKAIACVLVLGLAACSPQSLKTQWDWRSFAADPSEAHFNSLTADLAGCAKAGCEALSSLTDADIDSLSARIDATHPYAIRFGIRAHPLLAKGLPAAHLAHRYGELMSADPRAFLRAAKTENSRDFALATTTDDLVLDDAYGREAELNKRRDALLSVSDLDVQALRDAYIAEIGKAAEKADSEVFYVRPIAAAPRPPHLRPVIITEITDPPPVSFGPADPPPAVSPAPDTANNPSPPPSTTETPAHPPAVP